MSAVLAPGRGDTEVATAPYPVAFDLDTRFGRCVGLDLATALADPTPLPALLHPAERPLCHGMRGARLAEFVGGRLASRFARKAMPDTGGPTLRGPGGAPVVMAGVSLSISHTRRLAVALAHAGPGTVGVDVEILDEDGASPLLAERILSDGERLADTGREPIGLVQRLSLKEAAYKALHPRLGHIPLRRITVRRGRDGAPGYEIAAAGGVRVTAESLEILGHVLSFARAA